MVPNDEYTYVFANEFISIYADTDDETMELQRCCRPIRVTWCI